ncbi:putative disease resistance protein RGA3 [Salvia divinorum]|uniref:Disease resistance protein RGA3 n=1 Tax=Salvia divinorum TaxID=28513 RepID=A0ABD1HBZ2_SALDI
MIGLSNELAEMKEYLLKPLRPYDFGVYSHVGKIGSLRSITAKALFDEIFVAKEVPFDCGAWVTVGRNYQITEILTNIIAQVDDQARIDHGDMEKLGKDLYAKLEGRRYMIVLDDIDDVEAWDLLKDSFPEQDNGSLIVLATGLIEVAQFAKSFYIHEMPMLSDDFFWDFLRLLLFGCEKEIDPVMEKAGKKIAENCGGSRIALARVILFLYKCDMTPDHQSWTNLAADELHTIFVVHDEVSEVCKIREDAYVLTDDKKHTITSPLETSLALKLIKDVRMLQVADCSPSVVRWAEKMKESDWENRIEKLAIDVHSSWDDEKLDS